MAALMMAGVNYRSCHRSLSLHPRMPRRPRHTCRIAATVRRHPNGVQFQPAAVAAPLPQTSCPPVGARIQLAWTRAQWVMIKAAARQAPPGLPP
eukprot:8941780-Alexandrium_andersonii.AAC.1